MLAADRAYSGCSNDSFAVCLQVTEPTVGEKRCSECQEHKPASHFYKNRTNKDGLFGKCKLCSEGTKKERALNDVTVDRKVLLCTIYFILMPQEH